MPKVLENVETPGEIRIRIQLDECLPPTGENVREFVYGKGATFDCAGPEEFHPAPVVSPSAVNAARCQAEALALCEAELSSRAE